MAITRVPAKLFLFHSPLILLLLLQLQTQFAVCKTNRMRPYIVHTNARPSVFTTEADWHSALLESLESPSIDSRDRLLYSYEEVLNGFAAKLTTEEASKLYSVPGIVSVDEDSDDYQLYTTRSPGFLGLDSSYGIWPETGYGEDMVIGFIDTGIWPESPSFNDDGLGPIPQHWKGKCEEGEAFHSSLCNKKLIGARMFPHGIEAIYGPLDRGMDKLHYSSPRDSRGHGTHVASTAGGTEVLNASDQFGFANGTARGIATKARIAMYKVFWLLGEKNSTASDIIAAMDKAVQDGVNCLSLSIGSPFDTYHENAISVGAFHAMRKGVFVSAAAGNSGPDLFSVKNTAPWMTTVAAGTIDRTFRNGELEKRTIVGRERAPRVANFSSRGPNPVVPEILKPDIMAPGDKILAAWIPNQLVDPKVPRTETFRIDSGTSMSTPHVAAVAALLRSAHPTWSPAAIRSAMMTTSTILDNFDRPIVRSNDSEPQTPLAFGAGHVNPQRALDPGLVYDAGVDDYVDFLCNLNYTRKQQLKIVKVPVSCSTVKGQPGNLNYPSISTLFSHERRIQVFKRTLTNVAEETPETYTVKVINPNSDKVAILITPKRLTFEKMHQKYSYEVKLESKFNGTTDRVYAYIVWESENHFVRIPVVFMWRSL